MLKNNCFVYDDINNLSLQLAKDILNLAEYSIKKYNKFTIVLAGGDSFTNVYKILGKSQSDWSKWYVYIGDERYLKKNDKYRNDYTIGKIWLNNGLIPKKNINLISAGLEIKDTVLRYENILKKILSFDLVLLGMGEDGHTASLFPNRMYSEKDSVVVEQNSPKFPKDRISMSYSRLNRSRHVFKVVCGNSKKMAFNQWLKGKELPISKINGNVEKVFICKNLLSV